MTLRTGWWCYLAFAVCSWLAEASARVTEDENGNYLIGTGIFDMYVHLAAAVHVRKAILIFCSLLRRTGPAAQVNFMGYARPAQTGHGIHLRLRSRAFLMAQLPNDFVQHDGDEEEAFASDERRRPKEDMEERSLLRWNWKRPKKQQIVKDTFASLADPERTVCFVSIDAGMGSDLINMRVLKRLEELLPEQGTSGKRLCHLENLSIR